VTVLIEVNHLGEYEVYRRTKDDSAKDLIKFTEAEDAFAYADAMVPDEAVKLILAKAADHLDNEH
jgi:predicted RNA polymerase sigma factor